MAETVALAGFTSLGRVDGQTVLVKRADGTEGGKGLSAQLTDARFGAGVAIVASNVTAGPDGPFDPMWPASEGASGVGAAPSVPGVGGQRQVTGCAADLLLWLVSWDRAVGNATTMSGWPAGFGATAQAASSAAGSPNVGAAVAVGTQALPGAPGSVAGTLSGSVPWVGQLLAIRGTPVPTAASTVGQRWHRGRPAPASPVPHWHRG